MSHGEVESAYAWTRLAVTLILSTIGGVGMWSVVVALPAVQAEFAVARADASLPYTLTMICFGLAGIGMGRLSDRFGDHGPGRTRHRAARRRLRRRRDRAEPPVLHARARPADRRRQLGDVRAAARAHVAVVRSPARHRRRDLRERQLPRGHRVATDRRALHRRRRLARTRMSASRSSASRRCCRSTLLLRRKPPLADDPGAPAGAPTRSPQSLGLSANALQTLLIIAGLACCVAMSMPQVHLVAYCSDLGYGPARGAQMLSLMLACGIVSRLVFGGICDRIGGLRTLLLGSTLQGIALLLFLPFNGLVSLYVDLGAVRAVPGRHRPGVRDHRARILQPRRSRRARRRSSSPRRCSAWRSAAGCPARSST